MNECILDWSQHESPAKTEDDASNEIFIIFFYKAFYFFSHSLIPKQETHSILCYAVIHQHNEMYNYRLYYSSLGLSPSGMWDVWCLCYVFRALVFKYMTLIKITNDDDQLLVLNCFSFPLFYAIKISLSLSFDAVDHTYFLLYGILCQLSHERSSLL